MIERPPRVLVTRAPEDAPVLAQAIRALGFEPVMVPLLQRIWRVHEVAEAVAAWGAVDWVLVTSATTADVLGVAAPQGFPGARWAAVGPGTARRMQTLGFPVDLVPDRATAIALADALGPVEGLRMAYPHADLANPYLARTLTERGAQVLEVVAYTNVAPPQAARQLAEALPVDVTTLLSSSAAERVADLLPPDQREKLGRILVIGPPTAETAQRRGLPVDAMADPHTAQGVVEALLRIFQP